jgi:glycosyltransferase involved in cell wall biosynthesis
VVPVYNNPGDLHDCLSALLAESYSQTEIIVVDDASTDGTVVVAQAFGVRVLRLLKNSGPAAARNHGAEHARGSILFFVDADVVVKAGVIKRVANFFDAHPEAAAVFGSYDDSPRATGIVSRYRNLLHHFVHQNSNPEAATFWAGCGAVRREVFRAVGGFDERRYPRSSIEDIELGYRLRQGGHRIVLDKGLQGKHLKRWTFRSVVLTDVRSRAVPWTRLILERKTAPSDLNLKPAQRISGLLVMMAGFLAIVSLIVPSVLFLAGAAIGTVIVLNRDLYAFFFKRYGLLFSAASVMLHLLYFLYSGLSYVFVWAELRVKRNGLAKT